MSPINWGEKPVILVGHGCRMAGADMDILTKLGVPLLTSWQAMDLIDSDDPMNYGRCGLYGQRCANKVLYNADFVLAIGCRMSIWQCGYDDRNFAPNARIVMVDIDQTELDAKPHAEPILMDAKAFIESIANERPNVGAWIKQCNYWSAIYLWVESPTHDDANGYIHSHRFMERLQPYLKPDQIIVTDMGTAMIAAHQVLRLKPPQRIMTSGGLGEMGVALPAAIGASFASNKGEVLCLHCDGGMMMNLQELQTIVHHQLPIKIIVFSNDGYAMIKQTQITAGFDRAATDEASGVTTPYFPSIANAFGIRTESVENWEQFDKWMPEFMSCNYPFLIQVDIDPEQPLLPKLNPVRLANGQQGSPSFDNLSPIWPTSQ